jgi:hypothetical protein
MNRIFTQSAIVLAMTFGASLHSNASVIVDQLHNTGLDTSGTVVSTNGGIDGNWLVNGNIAVTYKHPAYAANSADSLWISSNAAGGAETNSATNYLYSTTFDLTGYDANTANISGLWGADNYGSIFLNGFDTGVSLDFGYSAFRNLNEFMIADNFVDGVNTLSVSLTNGHLNPLLDPGPGALRFDQLELTAATVEEPGLFALFGLGLVCLGFSRRQLG